MAIFLAGFVGMGGGVLFWAGGVQEWRAQGASGSWTAVTGRIASIGYSGKSRILDVYYEYEHAGRRFRSGHVVFGATAHAEMRAFDERYDVGDPVTVYLDPVNPGSSVLERRLGSRWFLMMVLGLFFAAVGLAVVRFVWLATKPGGEGLRGATIRTGRRYHGA